MSVIEPARPSWAYLATVTTTECGTLRPNVNYGYPIDVTTPSHITHGPVYEPRKRSSNILKYGRKSGYWQVEVEHAFNKNSIYFALWIMSIHAHVFWLKEDDLSVSAHHEYQVVFYPLSTRACALPQCYYIFACSVQTYITYKNCFRIH